MPDYIDISVPLVSGMLTWSSHEPVSLERSEHISADRPIHVTALQLGTHSGTHVDSPYHFSAGSQTVDQLPLESLMGPAHVHDFTGRLAIDASALRAAQAPAGTNDVRRVLLKTDNSRWVRTGPMPPRWAHLTGDAARFLVDSGVLLVGTDGLTVDGPDSDDAHVTLLQAGVVIVETLDLSGVPAGEYDLICLPLRIAGGDGAPARAILRQR